MKRPVGVSFVAAWCLVPAYFFAVRAWAYRAEAPAWAIALFGLVAIVGVVLGTGLRRLDEWARLWSIAFSSLMTAGVIANAARKDRFDSGAATSLVFYALPALYLLRRSVRSAFARGPAAFRRVISRFVVGMPQAMVLSELGPPDRVGDPDPEADTDFTWAYFDRLPGHVDSVIAFAGGVVRTSWTRGTYDEKDRREVRALGRPYENESTAPKS